MNRTLRLDAALAAVVAAALLPFTVGSLSDSGRGIWWTVTAVAAVCAVHAALAWRRGAPGPAYAVACWAMLVLVLMPPGRPQHVSPTGLEWFPLLFLPSNAVFLALLYSVCAGCERRTGTIAYLVALAGGLFASVRVWPLVPDEYPIWQYRLYLTFAVLLAITAAWGLGSSRGDLVRREAERRAEATLAAVTAERARIACDMHDIVAHGLAVVVRQAEGGAAVAGTDPQRAEQVLRTIADVGRQALTDMRGLLGVIRSPGCGPDREFADRDVPGQGLADRAAAGRGDGAPVAGGTAGPGGRDRGRPGCLPAGVPASLADLPALLERVEGTGLRVGTVERGPRQDLGQAGELAVYRLVLEALTNTIKHAGPGARACVTLDWAREALTVEVSDDGGREPGTGPADGRRAGTPAHAPVPGTGSGLRGLAERVRAVGGELEAGPGRTGFTVRATFPRRAR